VRRRVEQNTLRREGIIEKKEAQALFAVVFLGYEPSSPPSKSAGKTTTILTSL
jgi:hypothetical protein